MSKRGNKKPAYPLSRVDGLCFKAALEGNANNVAAYLKRGANVTQLDRTGLFVMVAQRGYVEVARVLLDAGANVNATMVEGEITALMQAAKAGHIEMLLLLIERGAHLETTTGINTMHWAAKAGQTECVRLLLEKGMPVDARNQFGSTALMWAARNGHLNTLEVLLQAGADVNAISNEQITALRWAQRHGHTAIAEMLRQKEARELPLSCKERALDRLFVPLRVWLDHRAGRE